jgi:hypothetical protein
MKVVKQTSVRFHDTEGQELTIRKSNRGEPYRDGVDFFLQLTNGSMSHLFIEDDEAKTIRDLLNSLYPVKS